MRVIRKFLEFVLYMAIVLIMTFLLIHFVAQRTGVSGTSMEPALKNGDQLIVDKISYRLEDPKRFDIVVFPYRFKRNTYFVKRIIGMPGETVRIDTEGKIYINGKILDEHYSTEVTRDPGMALEDFQLGRDEYFVLGDNRNVSQDSRFPDVGAVRRKEIIGKTWLRVYPFSGFGILKHG